MYLCEQSKAANMHAIFTNYKYILISSLFDKKILNNWNVILRLIIISIWYRHDSSVFFILVLIKHDENS